MCSLGHCYHFSHYNHYYCNCQCNHYDRCSNYYYSFHSYHYFHYYH
jgi:hypothetical protein